MIANYHTHTFRCNHASGTEREYIEAAINNGIKILGFSDHFPYIFKDGSESQYSVPSNLVDDYFSTLNSLKKEYKNDIEIHIGFECEYYKDLIYENLERIKKYNPEYLILGQHFLNNGKYSGSVIYNLSDVTEYVDEVIAGMQTGLFTYIAHPDLINLLINNSNIEIYKKEMVRLCQAAKKANIPLEFNLLGHVSGRNYPNDIFFTIANKIGNKVIIGLDAHTPKIFSYSNYLEYATKYLKSLNNIEFIEKVQLIDPYKI